MAYYLVTARPKRERLSELRQLVDSRTVEPMQPFGRALQHSLTNARVRPDGVAMWEEEDYCRPPLAEERAAVLDRFFDQIEVQAVARGSGWELIQDLPLLLSRPAA